MLFAIRFAAHRGHRVESTGLVTAGHRDICRLLRLEADRRGKRRREVGEALIGDEVSSWDQLRCEERADRGVLLLVVHTHASGQIETITDRRRALSIDPDPEVVQFGIRQRERERK